MTFFITQCPHCDTTFRTGISQLQSAEGMVRCGACLTVFAADDNLVPSAELQTVPLPTEEEDIFSLFEEEPDQPEPATFKQQDADDDILTLDLADSIPGRITPSISEQPIWEILGEVPPSDEETNAEVEANASPDIDVDLDAEAGQPAHHPEPAPALTALRASLEDEGSDDFLFDRIAAGKADEILELDWQQPPPRSPVLWPYAALLVLALLGQFVVHEFDALSENSRTRPWLQSACDVLGCQLPQPVDITAIHSDDLLVRSHPEFSNALSVNMTIRNSGNYPQPFPALNLRFSNARHEAVAVRSFTPAEYLPEGLPASTPMAVNSPVQIHLDILDPGIEAVNYEVSFSSDLSRQGATENFQRTP